MQATLIASSYSSELTAMVAAFVCCLALGAERHLHLKDAGIKTHILVGIGACVFTLVSAYGFGGVTEFNAARFDPSRIAAQIVSGIGFLGAGVIFVNNDTVRGLTTAATIWLSAAIGMACGAHMIHLAVMALALHYLLVFVVGPIAKRLPQKDAVTTIELSYAEGPTIMPQILKTATRLGYGAGLSRSASQSTDGTKTMRVKMEFSGARRTRELIHGLARIDGVQYVKHLDVEDSDW